jgi:hypothetical protein
MTTGLDMRTDTHFLNLILGTSALPAVARGFELTIVRVIYRCYLAVVSVIREV